MQRLVQVRRNHRMPATGSARDVSFQSPRLAGGGVGSGQTSEPQVGALNRQLGDPVVLWKVWATFSQTEAGDFSVARAIDGLKDNLGWAIWPETTNQAAVFETANNVGFPSGTLLTFVLTQTHLSPADDQQHTIGRFRFSVTSDDRNAFADGLPSGGDVTANWSIAEPVVFTSLNGATLTRLEDSSILASDFSPATDIYTVSVLTAVTNITGVRLEVLTHPSLPGHGPGRQPVYRNFVLTELEVTAQPWEIRAQVYPAVEVCWNARTNRTYSVIWSHRLDINRWAIIASGISGVDGTLCIFDTTRPSDEGFYRIIEE
jgi:hypothetical protein